MNNKIDSSYCNNCTQDLCGLCGNQCGGIPSGFRDRKDDVFILDDFDEDINIKSNLKEIGTFVFVRQEELDKIPKNCRKQCTMGKDIELIKKEVDDYPPYRDLLYLHELNLKECPKCCPKYKSL